MPALFQQNSFISGLDTELDPTKSPRDSYSLLINGRNRRDVIEPTKKHLQLSAPEGNYQGIYQAGSLLVLFISGNAYYADITESPITFQPIAAFTQMDAAVARIYAEIVPANYNFFNRLGNPDTISRVFNNSIAAFSQALFVFDGTEVNRPQAILPDGSVNVLQDFATWTMDNPIYVPFGVLPCEAANKLFLVSTNRAYLLQSVSGRANDFVVNITNDGNKGGDAFTTSTTVSFNPITSVRPLSTGQLLVSTLYASWSIDLDYTNTIFGEPDLHRTFLFPVGVVNELSSIDILEDTAFITQSGIHAFNAVAQAKRESNNFPLGAAIKGLLLNPQSNTCAINHDDYGFFAVNTKFGQGVLVYDTIRRKWSSLDLSFGHVKQFANTRISGKERLFFITHDNRVYEAFADTTVNSTHVYLGEWTPETPDSQLLSFMVDTAFLNVKTPGQVKFTSFVDGELRETIVLNVEINGYADAPPIPIPFTNEKKTTQVGWQYDNKVRGWNYGLLIEWNFDGVFSELSVDGEIERAENVELEVSTIIDEERLAFIGNSGYAEDLNIGEDFADGFICVNVIKGHKYIYFANGNGRLVSGNIIIHDKGIFTANNDTVAIEGPGIPTWSLRDATNFLSVLDALDGANALIGGGNHSYHIGTRLDTLMGIYPIKQKFYPVAGIVDIGADNGRDFYNTVQRPRYYVQPFQYIDFFFYDINGPEAFDMNSIQAKWLQNAIAQSPKKFKLVVLGSPPYSTEQDASPGVVAARLPFSTWGANAVLSAGAGVMERRVVDGFPYFVCGTGGNGLAQFAPGTAGLDAFRANDKFGYLEILSDPLTCKLTFKDVSNNILDTYALYA